MVASTAVAHRIPAGWYRDKDEPSRRRWWDGIEWTDHYAPVTNPLTLTELTLTELTLAEPTLAGSPCVEHTEPRKPAPRASIGSTLEQMEHSVHSSEIPIALIAEVPPARRSIPLAIIVLLAGLTGANIVLLSILVSGR